MRMASEGRLGNMLFYGQPGLGKTSAARMLIEQVEADTLQINGSLDTGIDTFRTVFVLWASACSLFDRQKVCFIDEGDYLSLNAQAALRGLIEAYPHVAFLMTANDYVKVDPHSGPAACLSLLIYRPRTNRKSSRAYALAMNSD